MDMEMTLEPAVVSFEKQLGPGVSVCVAGISAEIVRADGHDDLTLFDRPTNALLQKLLRHARTRMADGETDIRLNFADVV